MFEKSSGALIGYSDLKEINNLLMEVKRQQKNPEECKRPLAKAMIVFMVRELRIYKYKFVYVQLPAVNTKGANLFPIFRRFYIVLLD